MFLFFISKVAEVETLIQFPGHPSDPCFSGQGEVTQEPLL